MPALALFGRARIVDAARPDDHLLRREARPLEALAGEGREDDETVDVVLPGAAPAVGVDHMGGGERAGARAAVAGVPGAPIGRPADAGLARAAVAHQKAAGADGAEIVHGRDALGLGRGVDRRREQREEIVHVQDVRARVADRLPDQPHAGRGVRGPERRAQLRRPAADGVVADDARDHLDPGPAQGRDFVVDRDVLAAADLVSIMNDEDAHARAFDRLTPASSSKAHAAVACAVSGRSRATRGT